MSTERLNNIKPIHFKEDEQGNKFVLLSEDDHRFLKEKAERAQEIEHDKEHLQEEYRKVYEQNDHYREAIIEAIDLGLYGDNDSGIMTMYKILNEVSLYLVPPPEPPPNEPPPPLGLDDPPLPALRAEPTA